jgi:hypothetical protein
MAIPHMTGLTSGVAGRFECPAPEREDLLSTPPLKKHTNTQTNNAIKQNN